MQPQADTPAPAGVAAPAAPALARNDEVEVVPPIRNRSRSAPPERSEQEVIGMPPARERSREPRRRLQRSTPYPAPPPPAPVPAPVPVRRGRAPLDPNRETPPRYRFWHPEPPANELNPQRYPIDPNTGLQRGCPKCYWSWWGCAQCTDPRYNPRSERPDHVPDGGRAMGRGRKK